MSGGLEALLVDTVWLGSFISTSTHKTGLVPGRETIDPASSYDFPAIIGQSCHWNFDVRKDCRASGGNMGIGIEKFRSYLREWGRLGN
jgi:hypothetical protein